MRDITLNLTNCVSDITQYDTNSSNYMDFVLTADDGYVFKDDDLPSLESRRYGSLNQATATLSEDTKTAKIHTWIGSDTSYVTITGKAYEGTPPTPVKKVAVTTQLTACTANSDLPTEVEVGQTLNVTLTANEGSIFDKSTAKNIPRFAYTDEHLDPNEQQLTISEDGNTATGSIVMGDWSDFKIIGEAITKPKPVKKIKVTPKLTACTANSDLPTEVEVGQTLNVTLTANEGFIFDKNTANKIPRFSYSNENLDHQEQQLTISEDGNTATGSIVMGDWFYFEIIGEAITKPTPVKKIKVTPKLTACTANSDLPTEVEVGQTLNVTLTTNEGFIFDKNTANKIPRFSYSNENLDHQEQQLTISEDGNTATGSIVMGDWFYFEIIGEAITKPTPVKKVEVTTQLSNCTANSDLPTEVEVGQTLNVTLTANEGSKFDKNKSIPLFRYQNEHLDPVEKQLTISEDGQTATGSIVMGDWYYFRVVGDAYPVAVVGGKYGAVNVYLVTIDNLDEFSKKRYFRVTGTDPQTGASIYENVDLGDYVNKIIRIYTPIKASTTDVIRCGNYNTNISCLQPETDKITLDFGEVTIPNHNKNNVDFESDVQIFLPFLGFVNISNEYTGKTINLQYVINVVTGNGSALFSCDGVIFQVEKVEPRNNILYLSQNTESKTIGSDDWNERLFYGIEPYVLVKWYNSVGGGLNNDRKSGNIGSFTGFSRFDDIEPISTKEMLTDEQKQIYTLLNGGVYVE